MRGAAPQVVFLQNKNEMELVSMVKANKETTEKKEFAWDTEKTLGSFGDDKKKTEVRICTLNDKTYVSAQTSVMSAKTGDWKRTKNNTMEMSLFKELQHFVGEWELQTAFEGTSSAQVLKKEPKKSGGLKAKKQAEGAKAKATKKKEK
jgi:hypothetical protein